MGMNALRQKLVAAAHADFGTLLVGACALMAAFAGAILIAPPDSMARVAIADTGVMVMSIVAASAMVFAARATRGLDRMGWTLLAAGSWCWAIAECMWTYFDVIEGSDPFPSAADIFYLAGPPLQVAGMTMLGSQRRWQAQARALFEGLGLALAVTALGWVMLIEPVLAESTGSWSEIAISVAYPCTDLVLLWAVITLAYRVGIRRDPSLFIGLAGGAAAFVAADGVFAYMEQRGGYVPGLTDLGWMAGYTLFAVGARTYVRTGAQDLRETERPSAAHATHNIVPIASSVGMLLLGVVIAWNEPFSEHRVALTLGIAALLLSLARQSIVILDNLKLNRGLEIMRIQLESQVQELAAARDSADRANAAKSQFLSRMSHELRTPMNAVLGFGQLLQMEDLTPAQRENVAYIMSSGQHLLRLIDEVLDISRIEAGRMKVEITPVPCGDVIGQVMEMTAPIAAAPQVTLRHAESCDTTGVLADAARLKQVLLNLVSNAIKYNEAGGMVVIRSGITRAGRVAISVIDNGPGIRPEHLGRVFNPFDRLDADRRGVEGTGLGLVLSKALVEAMYGSIQVDSVYGKGTRFTVFLPLARRTGENHAGVLGRAPLSILHVDGDWSRRQLVERVLARRTGVKLVQAENVLEGKLLADSWRAFTIVVDGTLPEAREALIPHIRRAGGPNARARLVVLGPRDEAEFAGEWAPLGCDAWLPIPFEPEDLIRSLETIEPSVAAA